MKHPRTERLRVAFLFPYGYLESVPSLCASIELMSRHGYQVDVYTVKNSRVPEPSFTHPRVTVRLLPWVQGRIHEPSPLVFMAFLLWALGPCLLGGYRFLFGCGLRGLIAASFIALLRRTPVVYFNLELYLSWEMRGPYQLTYKRLERWANRRCLFTITQDDTRADLLAFDNGVHRDSVITLPNAPLGRACRRNSDFLRRKFGLGAESIIVLHAGEITSTTACLHLVRAAQHWPPEWVLVLHSRQVDDRPYLEEVRQADAAGRVLFSLEPVHSDQLDDLVASADIGVALYDSDSDNITRVGLSSGKLAYYLKNGLPVIATRYPGLQQVVEGYHCGICVDSADQVQDAIAAILQEYDVFSRKSLQCFEEVFSVEHHFREVVRLLDSNNESEWGGNE